MRKIYVFYVDVFLIQNILMDFLALSGTNTFLRRQKKWWMLGIVSVLSSIISLLVLLTVHNEMLYVLLSHFLINSGMLMAAFGVKNLRYYLENWMITYMIVILYGGSFEWLGSNAGITLGVVCILINLMLGFLKQRKDFENGILDVRMYCKKEEIILKGYWDSGNCLRDPYTGRGVCIVAYSIAEKIFDKEKDTFRLIPYVSLGETNGMLWSTTVDKMEIKDGKKLIVQKNVTVGIAEEGLLEGKEYNLILHQSFL